MTESEFIYALSTMPHVKLDVVDEHLSRVVISLSQSTYRVDLVEVALDASPVWTMDLYDDMCAAGFHIEPQWIAHRDPENILIEPRALRQAIVAFAEHHKSEPITTTIERASALSEKLKTKYGV